MAFELALRRDLWLYRGTDEFQIGNGPNAG